LILGGQLSSQPSWRALGLGAEIDLVFAPLAWLELGIGFQAMRGRSVAIDEVQALYTSWPIHAWSGFRLGFEEWELDLSVGLQLAWTRMEALLERLGGAVEVARLNPALFGRLGLRYYTPWGIALQLVGGPTGYLRRQRYTYGAASGMQTVLRMQSVSLEAGLQLVVPLD
jgi:hypothetical protein